MTKIDVRSTFEALEPLDLARCQTVGQLVRAMSKCSFVARQIGEVAETLLDWVKGGQPYHLVFAGEELRDWFGPHFFNLGFRGLQVDWTDDDSKISKVLVVGRFGEEQDKTVHQPEQTIFINREGLCRPGQVQDGYFPNVVFEDPRFVLPVISAALDEWLEIKVWTVTELFTTLPQYGGVAAEVVQAARVLQAMVDDPDCTVFMTASGAMTVAQLAYLFCDMIEGGMIQYLATTGALMAHGLVQSTGCKHFKHRPEHGDALYAEQKINRVTDTLEPEENFAHIDEIMGRVLTGLADECPEGLQYYQTSPSRLHRAIGAYLVRHFPQARGILKSAYEHQTPVCVPACTDSELGNDVFCFNAGREQQRQSKLLMNLELDTQLLMDLAFRSKRMGIFSIGGGVPRNNTQNVAPLIEIFKARLGRADLPDRHFHYGCRICPDPLWHGHLSGCTYSENESWRKMANVRTSGNFAEVHADATATWPFILKWVMDNRSVL